MFLLNFVVQAQLKDWNSVEGCIVDNIPTFKCIEVVFSNILFLSSAFVILILFVMFMIGGWNYLTSFGNPERLKKAQGILRYALLGLLLYASAFLILNMIDKLFLGGAGKIFKFEIPEISPPPPFTPTPLP